PKRQILPHLNAQWSANGLYTTQSDTPSTYKIPPNWATAAFHTTVEIPYVPSTPPPGTPYPDPRHTVPPPRPNGPHTSPTSQITPEIPPCPSPVPLSNDHEVPPRRFSYPATTSRHSHLFLCPYTTSTQPLYHLHSAPIPPPLSPIPIPTISPAPSPVPIPTISPAPSHIPFPLQLSTTMISPIPPPPSPVPLNGYWSDFGHGPTSASPPISKSLGFGPDADFSDSETTPLTAQVAHILTLPSQPSAHPPPIQFPPLSAIYRLTSLASARSRLASSLTTLPLNTISTR
ncbi:hypothetical protein SARC_13179, partial [Sphaeroforma arctica JP610]